MAQGLKSSRKAGGAYNSAGLNVYRSANSYGTALFAGDPVTLSAGNIVRAANGDKVIGAAVGFVYIDANKNTIYTSYLPASTSSSGTLEGDARPLVLVDDNPTSTFTIPAANALVVSAGQIGLYAAVSIGAGDTNAKRSNAVVNATVTSLDQSMFRIVGLVQTPGNVYDVSAQMLEVVFSNHALKA